MPVYKFQPKMTPKTRLGGIVAAIAGLGLGALMLFLGVFVALILLALGLVFVLGFKLRQWWLTRFGGQSATNAGAQGSAAPPGAGTQRSSGQVLEGEYEVLKPPSDQP